MSEHCPGCDGDHLPSQCDWGDEISRLRAENEALAGKLHAVESQPCAWCMNEGKSRAEQAEAKVKELEARLKKSEASLEAIAITDGKAREVVKELLGVNPDGAERMWFETSQRLMAQVTDLEANLAAAQRENLEDIIEIDALKKHLAAALEEIKGMREHHEKCEGDAVSAYRKMIDERNAALEANKILKSRLDYAENGDGRGL